MEKIYIVSGGSYSDWHIKAIFKNKDKAEFYTNNCIDCDLNGIEEYELSDDKEIIPIYIVEVNYYWDEFESYTLSKEKRGFNFEIRSTNTLDNPNGYNDYTSYFRNRLFIRRAINNSDFDQEELKLKYKKICEDYVAQINYDKSLGIEDWEISKKFH